MNRRKFIAAVLTGSLARAAVGFTGMRTPLSKAQIGASTACLPGLTLLEAIQAIRQMGFSTLEMIAFTGARHAIGAIPGFAYHRMSEAERRRVYDATRSFRHISAHLPFHDLHLFSWDEDVRAFSLDLVRKGLDGLAFLEGELAVMHVGGSGSSSYRDQWQQMVDTFRALGDYAGARGLRIGIETMQPHSVEEYTQLIFDIDHPHVGATIDTGHIRGASDIKLPPEQKHSEEGRARFNDVLAEIVDRLGAKVMHVHLSDVRSSDWRDHQTVGSGIVDFPRFLRMLELLRFEGLMVFELEEPESAQALVTSKAYVEELIS